MIIFKPIGLTPARLRFKMNKINADDIDKASISWAGRVFNDKKFQELADFKDLGQLEKDRIFNELVIAPLALLMITLESTDTSCQEHSNEYLSTIKENLPKAHISTLKNYGVEEKYLDDWYKLINMRYQEYIDSKWEARKAMMDYENQEGSLEFASLLDINILLPVFIVAVGCHNHICRGETNGKDLLFKYLITTLSRFYIRYRALIEGKNISILNKIRMTISHVINDIKNSWSK